MVRFAQTFGHIVFDRRRMSKIRTKKRISINQGVTGLEISWLGNLKFEFVSNQLPMHFLNQIWSVFLMDLYEI